MFVLQIELKFVCCLLIKKKTVACENKTKPKKKSCIFPEEKKKAFMWKKITNLYNELNKAEGIKTEKKQTFKQVLFCIVFWTQQLNLIKFCVPCSR
jgi:hypothetical protein